MVSIRSHCTGKKTTVDASQQRFYLQKSLMDLPSSQVWAIPVCFEVGAAKDCRLLEQKQQEFEFAGCVPELSADADGSGYYRTQYADNMLRRLPGTSWDASQRDRLVGDTWALVRAGKQSVGDYLDLIRRMGADRERVVLETELQPIPTIARLADTDDRNTLSALVRELIGARAKSLGWSPVANESDDNRQLRPVVISMLGAYGNDPETIREARRLAEQYLQDRSILDPSIVSAVLGLAARGGDAALYDRYSEAARTAKSPEEFLNFLYAMVSFRDPELVRRTLETAVSAEVRSQDSPYILVALLSNPETRKQSWAWMKEHWADVQARFTISSGARVVAAAGAFCDAAEKEDVESFFANHTVQASERAFGEALHSIDACIELRDQQRPNLSAWLRTLAPEGTPKASGGGAPAASSSNQN